MARSRCPLPVAVSFTLRVSRFIRTDVDAAVHDAWEAGQTPLIEQQRRREGIGIKAWIAGIDGWAVHEQTVRQGRSAVIAQGAEHRIGVANIADGIKKTAGAG